MYFYARGQTPRADQRENCILVHIGSRQVFSPFESSTLEDPQNVNFLPYKNQISRKRQVAAIDVN